MSRYFALGTRSYRLMKNGAAAGAANGRSRRMSGYPRRPSECVRRLIAPPSRRPRSSSASRPPAA